MRISDWSSDVCSSDLESERYVRAGKWIGWGPMAFIGQDVDHKTLGVAGLGRIGSRFARKAAAFNMKLIYSDAKPNAELERELGATFVDKETLLRESDFLSLHLPDRKSTRLNSRH